jgi:hypothetical protein
VGREKVAATSSIQNLTKNGFFVNQVFSRQNIFILSAFSLFLSSIDTIESYYLQRVLVNPFAEANLIPARFYEYGLLGYIAYLPVEFLATLALFVALWGLANYTLWYYTHFIRRTRRPQIK